LKIALLSDIHSNLEALQKVDEQLSGLTVYYLGDLVGYGANPNEVIAWVKERKVVSVMGNHDYAALTTDTSWFNPSAGSAIDWTINNLNAESRIYLKDMPQTRFVDIGELKMMMIHGSPTDPLYEYVYQRTHQDLFEYYLDRFKVDIISLGHTHEPFVWRGKKGLVINPGSVGQPRTGISKANYSILEFEGNKIECKQMSTEYEVYKAAEKIISAGLPHFQAERLFNGI
jgi:putative phosphoesterase